MNYTKDEVLQFVEENDVKFVKLAFCDALGALKNVSILSHQLYNAFENGLSIDAASVSGFEQAGISDLFLFPDPKTVTLLPWRPQQGRVARLFCDIKYSDGTFFEGDARQILKKAVAKLKEKGYGCRVGSECEFYLFRTDNDGEPTKIPHDYAGYLDCAPLDRGENVRREICLALEEMGITPETSHHEHGYGQNEIDFNYSSPLAAADNFMNFKSVVKSISAQNGLFASFMPKPFDNESGSGLHINLTLTKNGESIFKIGDEHCPEAESFIQGILSHAREITLFTNPTINSYKRFGMFEAPKFVSWSHQNRSQLIRIPSPDDKGTRMEYRSPDPSCNPYIVFSLLIYAGLSGIEKNLKLSKPVNVDFNVSAYSEKDFLPLPKNMLEAINEAKISDFVKENLGKEFVESFINLKMKEWNEFSNCNNEDDFFDINYFRRL